MDGNRVIWMKVMAGRLCTRQETADERKGTSSRKIKRQAEIKRGREEKKKKR